MEKIIKTVRKELKIPDNMDTALYKLAGTMYQYQRPNTVFIAQDSNGAIIELSKKPGPFVAGQLLYSRFKVSPKPRSPKSVPKKSEVKKSKQAKQLKPCPPGKIRNPATGRCVSEIKKSKK